MIKQELTVKKDVLKSRLPIGRAGRSAEIRLSSDGKFIYVSNRGQANNLNVFEVG